MPAGVVRTPEDERLWDKAKRQAAMQGRAGDYGYVMGIFKQMTGRKSMAPDLGKSFVIAPAFRRVRIGGQVPRSPQQSLDKLAVAPLMTKPPAFMPAMLLDHTDPHMTATSVVSNLGLDPAAEVSWRQFLGKAFSGADSELTARQQLHERMRQDAMGPELRRALFQRAMSYWRQLRKAPIRVFTVDDLSKASGPYMGPRGGKWADPRHTIPWKQAKKRPSRRDLDDDYEGPIERGMDVAQAEEAIRDLPVEHLVVFGSDGRQLYRQRGDERSCPITPVAAQRMRADRNAVFTHNHPAGGCLSVEDINVAVQMNVRQMRATNPAGFAFILTRSADGWGVPAEDLEPDNYGRSVFTNRLRQTWGEATDRARTRMDQRIETAGGQAGDASHPAFSQEVFDGYVAEESFHRFNERLGKWYGWEIRREGRASERRDAARPGHHARPELARPVRAEQLELFARALRFAVPLCAAESRSPPGLSTSTGLVSIDELRKAVGHKYIRRVPKSGGGYRYYYRESAAAREAKAGEEIKLGRRTAKVLDVAKDGTVTLELDGQRRRVSPNEWHDLLTRHYGRTFTRSAERRARQAINAVLRHVPRQMLEDLEGATDEERLVELEKRVPAVYGKLQAAFRRAGLSPFAAKRVLSRTLERRGWEAEARALVIGSVIRFRELGARELIDASEGLAGGKRVEVRHVATVIELRAPNDRPANFPGETKRVAEAAEKELAELSALLARAKDGKVEGAEVLAKALASTAIQKLNLITQAFPGLQDRIAAKAREVLPEVAALAPRREPTREGAETVAYVAGEGGKPKALAARYRLVEARELVASHDPDSFARRKDYPSEVQERAYHRDKSEQAKVIRNAQQLNPQFVVNTNPDAVNGPPLVTDDGIVLGGNSRVMSMQRVYSQHPERAKALRDYLVAHAHEAGLTPADVEALEKPVLIREVAPEDKSKRGLQLLVRQMNESFTQAMDPRTMQVAMGRKLSDKDLESLAGEMEEDETLNAFLASSRSERFVNALFRAGVVDSRNANQYLTKGTRTLNNDGRLLVSRILVGRVVQDADVLSDTGTQMMESIARAIPAMVQAKASGEGYDLGDDLRVAIDAFNDLQRRVDQGVIPALDPKMSERSFGQLFNYFMVLPGIGEPHAVLDNNRARMLLEVLVRKRGPVQMAKVFRDYAKRAAQNPEGQVTMFGAKSPDQILTETVQDALGKTPTKLAASLRLVATADLLSKAEPRGGKYHRRVPRPGGGYRYLYDPNQYARGEGAHISGDEATVAAVRKGVRKHIDEAGDGGCPIDRLRPLVKRYGAKVVGAVLTEDAGGNGGLRFERGKLFAKSDRFILRSA